MTHSILRDPANRAEAHQEEIPHQLRQRISEDLPRLALAGGGPSDEVLREAIRKAVDDLVDQRLLDQMLERVKALVVDHRGFRQHKRAIVEAG